MRIVQDSFGGRICGWHRVVWLACFLLLPEWWRNSARMCMRIEGVVTDPSGAVVPGAQVQAGSGDIVTTDALGQFVLACVPAGGSDNPRTSQWLHGRYRERQMARPA